MTEDDPTRPLREALAVSPDNLPLRRHLADTLARIDRHEEAEEEYRTLLRGAPEDDGIREALAATYLAQGKTGHAAVIAELLTGRERPLASAFVLLSRVRLAEREFKGARTAFAKAVELDADLARSPIAEELGLRAVNPFDSEEPAGEPIEIEGMGAPDPSAAEFGEPDAYASRGKADGDDGDGRIADHDFERPDIAFADVGGMDDVKEEIAMKVIQPLAHPELFAAYGKAVGGGVLMYGPPGCGKTHLARATAGEAKATFMSVGIHEVLDLWIGSSERNLHRIFEEARRRAPCVLFFDEVDALGAKRADASSSTARQIINQFLSELDGVKEGNDGVLVLAATNAPWHLDPAFRRPGRFDRLVFVPPPDPPAREAILKVLLRDKPVDGVDLARVAKKTDRFSGADLKGLLDVAIEAKLRDALKSGAPSPLTEKDLVKAAKKVRPTTQEWFQTAKNHVMFANEGGHYDDVAEYLGLKRPGGNR